MAGWSSPPTGTVTFLFTDIEGSTPLWDSFPDAMGPALARHDEILRSAIDAYGGHVFSSGGDGFGAVFSRAADAVTAALVAQRELARESSVGGPVLRVRMGVHTGEAEERDGDYFGPPVNRAARIMGAANGGQVVVSDLTAGLVEPTPEVKLIDLGLVELKGVIEPLHVYGVAGDGHDWIDVPLLTSRISRGNLPRLQTESVGDLANLQRRVANLAAASVVTLTGSGGVGKTRAAIEIGWLKVDEFVDGVWMVELAPVADPDLVVTMIASVLGARLQPGQTMVGSIVEWCFGRRMLLILDNCEHVLDPVIEAVQSVLASCPTVTLIATSREPLKIPGERVVRVASLEQRDATELFVLRARSADAGFDPTDADHEAIEAICRRLDGIPLAIELAAARIRSLSPAELLERLDDRFRLLRGTGRGRFERHQTLRETVTWSYQLLTPDGQLLFDRLSVFAGSFDLAAAEAICTGDDLEVDDVIDVLGDLVDKSMVIASRTERGTRYRLLETLRQYGQGRLDDRNETAAIRHAHLQHFADLAEHLQQHWESPDQAAAGDRFDDDWENLSTAHSRAITTRDIESAQRLYAAATTFATTRLRRDHQEWGERTLELAEETGYRNSWTLAGQGYWAFVDGDNRRAIELGERASAIEGGGRFLGHLVALSAHMAAGHSETGLTIAAELRAALPALVQPLDRHWATFAILVASTTDPELAFARDVDHLSHDYEAALAAARAIGAPSNIAQVLRIAAFRWYFTNPPEPDRAATEFEEAIRLHDSVGTSALWEWMCLTWNLTIFGSPRAANVMKETLVRAYDDRYWSVVGGTFEAAPVLLAEHAPDIAATIAGHLEHTEPPYADGPAFRVMASNAIQAVPDVEAHRARGNAMDRYELVALTLAALGEIDSDPRPQTAPTTDND